MLYTFFNKHRTQTWAYLFLLNWYPVVKKLVFSSGPVCEGHLSPSAFIPNVAFMLSISFARLRIKYNKERNKTKVQEARTSNTCSRILGRLIKISDPQFPPRIVQIKYTVYIKRHSICKIIYAKSIAYVTEYKWKVQSSVSQADPETRILGKWFTQGVLPGEGKKGGEERKNQAKAWFQAKSQP